LGFNFKTIQETIMGMIHEFKKSPIKGNVADMAVGVIIAAHPGSNPLFLQ
jgi:hypothetical protein